MLILLPPSEGKAAPRRGHSLRLEGLSFPELYAARAGMIDALTTLCAGDPEVAARTLGLGSTQADEVARNAALRDSPTARADAVYNGVLYEALDVASLDAGARRRANRWLAVTSSLFGLVRPGDRIPAYRLAGGVSLSGTGPVATYWSRHLDAAMRQAAGRGLVVDLRSSTYVPFWRPAPDLASKVVTVRVLHEVGGVRRVVSHFNKATKGRLIRTLVDDGSAPSSPARFADHLAALGWKTELGARAKGGTRLDVVVSDL
ncbi:MAG TPA: peroxide stress protein YaaA [Nocardioides sp.]|uniref:YaaA family protein n=1 Tax=Nocardioides sp. TaxID=35761 RepID=UPI002D7FD23A|nr:peroxide stress protein YaaA [Nocardioides sp.]HET6654225.1 peroxide stress protein YaaA [Nocardioides sp.]